MQLLKKDKKANFEIYSKPFHNVIFISVCAEQSDASFLKSVSHGLGNKYFSEFSFKLSGVCFCGPFLFVFSCFYIIQYQVHIFTTLVNIYLKEENYK